MMNVAKWLVFFGLGLVIVGGAQAEIYKQAVKKSLKKEAAFELLFLREGRFISL